MRGGSFDYGWIDEVSRFSEAREEPVGHDIYIAAVPGKEKAPRFEAGFEVRCSCGQSVWRQYSTQSASWGLIAAKVADHLAGPLDSMLADLGLSGKLLGRMLGKLR